MGLIRLLRTLLGLPTPPSRSRPAAVISPRSAPQRVSAPVPTKAKLKRDISLQRLSLDRFAPLSREDLARASRSGLLRGTWSFWSRHTIPPSSEPAANFIDRSMVAEGLLTPEDLIEIHETGDQWRTFHPDHLDIIAAGSAAITDSEAARLQRKAEKKAEAARRREEHARAVAARKAQDIIFLGRGVSSRLHDRRSNVERLESTHLPLLVTPSDIATWLGITIPRLRWLAFHHDAAETTHYITFSVPKKTGGLRHLSAPHRDMAAVQRNIFEKILGNLALHDCAHGFVPKRSIVTNAQPHAGAAILINVDLKDFFPSIGFPRIRGLFTAAGYSPCVATVLALLCTESPRREITFKERKRWVAEGPRALPQGACTSPALANLVARQLDRRLAGLAKAWGWTYTRYADDLTLSARDAGADVGKLLTALRRIVEEERFTVNETKTRVLRQNQAMEVTGLVVNERPRAPRSLIRRVRAILHQARLHGLASQNREQQPNFSAWLDGMISYISMTDAEKGAEFRKQFQALPHS